MVVVYQNKNSATTTATATPRAAATATADCRDNDKKESGKLDHAPGRTDRLSSGGHT